MVPTGFRFCPTDEELIEILHNKVSGNTASATASFDFIVERNIYDFEPKNLNWSESGVGLNKNERYYYCKRESDSREVMGRGWWKATSHVKDWRLCKIKYKGKEKLVEAMTSMGNVCRNNMTTPALNFEVEDGGSSSSISTNVPPMQLEVAFEQPRPLPLNDNLNYDNYGWSNSIMMFNDDDHLDLLANQLDDTVSEQPFSELWSWDNWY
ncbi:hypothetical protein GQ457_13G017530 [Hibiscus cannabinus]